MTSTPIATRRSHNLLLRLFPVICALPILLGLGCYLLIRTATSQDADVQQRARTYIERTLVQVENEIGHNIINYAKWGEAYKHLHLTVDLFWANDERNVGDIPYELYGYNGVFVLDPQDRTVYAVIDGRPTERAAAQWLEGDLAGLLAETRQRPGETESLVRVLSVGGVPALVAAATITPGASYSVAPGPGAPSVMLFVNVLDPDTLAHLSDTYGLPRLEASRAPLADHQYLQFLDSPLLLNWQPPQPGAQLLRRTLPIFLAGVLLLGLVLALLIRHALNSARQLDRQFDALVASQAELSRSESRFRELAEAASDWLWEATPQAVSPICPNASPVSPAMRPAAGSAGRSRSCSAARPPAWPTGSRTTFTSATSVRCCAATTATARVTPGSARSPRGRCPRAPAFAVPPATSPPRSMPRRKSNTCRNTTA